MRWTSNRFTSCASCMPLRTCHKASAFQAADSAGKFRAFNQHHPGLIKFSFYFGHRTIEVDRPASVANHNRLQSQAPRIERRVADAIVVGKPGQEDAGELPLFKITS